MSEPVVLTVPVPPEWSAPTVSVRFPFLRGTVRMPPPVYQPERVWSLIHRRVGWSSETRRFEEAVENFLVQEIGRGWRWMLILPVDLGTPVAASVQRLWRDADHRLRIDPLPCAWELLEDDLMVFRAPELDEPSLLQLLVTVRFPDPAWLRRMWVD